MGTILFSMVAILDEIYSHIDHKINEHTEKLREFIRQPTVSNTGEGMEEGAELLKSYFEELGCQTVEISPTPGWPVVYGDLDAGAEKTLIIYMMYDCMPADEPTWTVPPFEARLVDNYSVAGHPPFKKVLMARGAQNSKGPLVAFLNAVSSINEVAGKPPVNLKFVAEGEEEQASIHLPEWIEAHKADLKKADAMFFPLDGQNLEGVTKMMPGTKGISYMQLECSGATWGRGPKTYDIHGCNKVIIDSPVWRMIQALSTMTTVDGNTVLIDGWYDNVTAPTMEEKQMLEDLVESYNFQLMKDTFDVDRFILDEETEKMKLLTRYYCEPSGLNIDGIYGGYTGPGSKTVLPYKATVKMDVRFVPNQKSEEFIRYVRSHLDRHGFPDITVTQLTRGEWARTSPRAPIWQAIKEMYDSFGVESRLEVRNPGYAPFSLFSQEPLNLPGGFGWGMLGHGDRAHAPDEYFVIEGNEKVLGLAGAEKSFVSVLYNYAAKF